jgi:hypothetical protein
VRRRIITGGGKERRWRTGEKREEEVSRRLIRGGGKKRRRRAGKKEKKR